MTDGLTIYSLGLRVTGGVTVNTVGMMVATGGLTVAYTGVAVASGGLSVVNSGLMVSEGLTVYVGITRTCALPLY